MSRANWVTNTDSQDNQVACMLLMEAQRPSTHMVVGEDTLHSQAMVTHVLIGHVPMTFRVGTLAAVEVGDGPLSTLPR